jgi:hypothetical protein
VLAGIAVGSILGLVSGDARLVLLEGSVPTAVFGVLCLASLRSRRRCGARPTWPRPRARVVIVETSSPGTALAISKVMPYAVAGVLAAWMTVYGRHARRQGERTAASAAAQPSAATAS